MQKTRTIYLHIGRHKTGTSSVQHYVANHLNTLPGLYYPTSGRKGIAHHEFANAISHQVAKTAALQDTLLQSTVVSDMRAEIDAQSDDVLISSEALQNTSPRFVARIFQGYRIRTLVYIRNQVDYLASSYAQKVWATDYADTMESFYRSIFGGNYQQFLAAWQSISDAGMKVRLFERGALSHGDIVADFYEQMLEINDPATIQAILDRETIDSNPSLTADLLAFKLVYNAYRRSNADIDIKTSQENQLRLALAELSRDKSRPGVRTTSALKVQCADAYRDSNQQVADDYFQGTALFDFERPTAEPCHLSDADIEIIAGQLCEVDPRLSDLIEIFLSQRGDQCKAA